MKKKLLFILFLLLCLPLFAKTEVCETEKVTIDSFEVIKTEGNAYYYEYEPNMPTWNDYIVSDLNEDFQISKHNEIQPKNYEHLDYCHSLKMNSDYVENEDPIISSEQACYTFETPTGFCK